MLDDLLPALRLRLPAAGTLAPLTLFAPPVAEAWLEVGFGGGEHLAAQAAANPRVGLIGCEPFVNGVVSLLGHAERGGLRNLRIWTDSAVPLLDALADASIARAFVLFPDPWPKLRQQKRRFVAGPNLDRLARVLTDGAELRLASDDADYVRWMLFELGRHPAFEWLARRPADWRERPADWPGTRYEQKARAQGIVPSFLRFRRKSRAKSA